MTGWWRFAITDRAKAALSQGMGQPSALDRELIESMAQALE